MLPFLCAAFSFLCLLVAASDTASSVCVHAASDFLDARNLDTTAFSVFRSNRHRVKRPPLSRSLDSILFGCLHLSFHRSHVWWSPVSLLSMSSLLVNRPKALLLFSHPFSLTRHHPISPVSHPLACAGPLFHSFFYFSFFFFFFIGLTLHSHSRHLSWMFNSDHFL